MRNDEFMARRAYVHLGVMENQILQMDEFAGDPHTGDGLEKIRPFDKAWSNL
jgi:hypothetical protein